jgi:hypothetical protein
MMVGKLTEKELNDKVKKPPVIEVVYESKIHPSMDSETIVLRVIFLGMRHVHHIHIFKGQTNLDVIESLSTVFKELSHALSQHMYEEMEKKYWDNYCLRGGEYV